MAWLGLITGLYLLPALWRGPSFGPFDVGRALSGLGGGAGARFHNGWLGDQIEEFIPWNYFDWQWLHHLHFPLWNPYVALGLPQFFNFQSSVLSLPDLVGYLFPARLAFLVAVAVKLLLAGGGVYVFCRCLRLGRPAALFAATAFELSGAFANEIGWPLGDVMAWLGWVFAFSYLLYTGRSRRAALPFLALSVAGSLYGGFPEGNLLLAGAWLAFFGALAVQDRRAHRPPRAAHLVALAVGWAAGACLAAPLWLPGLQLLALSGRLAVDVHPAVPVRALAAVFVPGYYGTPLAAGRWFGPLSYNETAAYLGGAALVACCAGAYAGRGRREVRALVVAAILLCGLAYDFGPLQWLVALVPHLGAVVFGRARIPLAFLLSVLAGYGVEALVSPEPGRSLRRAYHAGLALVAAVPLALLARFALAPHPFLDSQEARLRLAGFFWPLALLPPLVWVALELRRRSADRRARVSSGLTSGRLVFAVLLGCETLLLLVVGMGVNAYSPQFFAQTPAERTLVRLVGGSRVGLASRGGDVARYPGVGVIPELNVAYGLSEFAAYDPMVPQAYFTSWARVSGTPPAQGGWFVPPVRSAAVARTFGVRYVLAAHAPAVRLAAGYHRRLVAALAAVQVQDPAAVRALALVCARYVARPDIQGAVPFGSPGFAAALVARFRSLAAPGSSDPDALLVRPYTAQLGRLGRLLGADVALRQAVAAVFVVPPWNGLHFVADVGGESLWSAAGAARFSLLGSGGRVVSRRLPGDSTWVVSVDAPRPSRLIVRLTDVPGWHARIDGRPAALAPYLGVMQSVAVPAGTHRVVLWYWPPLFTVGLALAAAAAAVLLVAACGLPGRQARRPGHPMTGVTFQ